MGVNMNGIGEFEPSYHLFNKFIKVMTNGQPLNLQGFANHRAASP